MRSLLKLYQWRIACALAFSAGCVNAASDPGDLVEQWLSLEVQRGKLGAAWHDRKMILDQQIILLEEEAQNLRELIENHTNTATDTERERAEILQQQTQLEAEQETLRRLVDKGAHQLIARSAQLPPPLQQAWQPKFSHLQNDESSLSDRLDVLLQLLTQLHEFDQRVGVHTGSLHAGDGTDTNVHVTQVYLGVARGWYVSADGGLIGYGEARPEGWQWWHGRQAQDLLQGELDADTITHLINVVQNPEEAAFTAVPLRVERQ